MAAQATQNKGQCFSPEQRSFSPRKGATLLVTLGRARAEEARYGGFARFVDRELAVHIVGGDNFFEFAFHVTEVRHGEPAFLQFVKRAYEVGNTARAHEVEALHVHHHAFPLPGEIYDALPQDILVLEVEFPFERDYGNFPLIH
jgi:hypothetical protein